MARTILWEGSLALPTAPLDRTSFSLSYTNTFSHANTFSPSSCSYPAIAIVSHSSTRFNLPTPPPTSNLSPSAPSSPATKLTIQKKGNTWVDVLTDPQHAHGGFVVREREATVRLADQTHLQFDSVEEDLRDGFTLFVLRVSSFMK